VLALAAVAVLGHLQLTGKDQLQSRWNLADTRHGLSRAVRAPLTETRKSRKLVIGQSRKHLRGSRSDGDPGCIGHPAALPVLVERRNESARTVIGAGSVPKPIQPER